MARAARVSRAALQRLRGDASGRLSRRGLHPLVTPLAESDCGSVIGSLIWPIDGQPAALVETRRGGHTVVPLGTPAHFARRSAVEADIAGGKHADELVSFFSAAAVEAGGLPYQRGSFASGKLTLDQFLLLRVGPFADVWERLAANRIERGETTAGLIAAERGAAHNPGWGCCLWAQGRLLRDLGRLEEARDVSVAALETPFWSLGAPVSEVQAAAQLGHVPDVRALMREVEVRGHEGRGFPPLSEAERARTAALDRMDAVVAAGGDWDAIRPALSSDLRSAGLLAHAEVAADGA